MAAWRPRSQAPGVQSLRPAVAWHGRWPAERRIALLSAAAAALALGVALAAERLGGLVPCALCLVERWPYRAAIVLSLLAAVLPRPASRLLLWLAALSFLAGAALAAVHVGVEWGWWQSPLPECAAPRFHPGTLAQRLASMPARPAKPCDAPSFLVPGLPVSMAAANLLYATGLAVLVTLLLGRTVRRG